MAIISFSNKDKYWTKVLIMFLFAAMTIVCYVYYNKFQDSKYAYNRNCYYRIDTLLIKADKILTELQDLRNDDKVSKEDILKLQYLASSISNEATYLNFEVHDYNWKIDKAKKLEYESVKQGNIIRAYFSHIEKDYADYSYLDLKKEAEALDYVALYYKNMKAAIRNSTEEVNFESSFKPDILEKASWIDMVSRLNKFEEEFNNENISKILPKTVNVK